MNRTLTQDQVDELSDGAVVTVLWENFKGLMFTYRVRRFPDGVYCTERLDGEYDWRPTMSPLPLRGVTQTRPGTIVIAEGALA